MVASSITYYPFGDIKYMEYANGQVQQFKRNLRYALKELKDGTSENDDEYHKLTYAYDAFGNITSIQDDHTALGHYPDYTSMVYDDLHQITDATVTIGSTDRVIDYAYNAAGNRYSRTEDITETYYYTANTNRLTQVKNGENILNSFAYNDLGDIVNVYEHLAGSTDVYSMSYTPSGLLYSKEDWNHDGSTITQGDTIMSAFMPNSEMVGKANIGVSTKFFAYDLAGNIIAEASPTEDDPGEVDTEEPLIDHIYLGGHRIASITQKGDACFIATIAYGSRLSEEIFVFRDFRDRVLKRFGLGRSFVGWYYEDGPRAASWIKEHNGVKRTVGAVLTVVAVPIRVVLSGNFYVYIVIFLAARRWMEKTIRSLHRSIFQSR